MIKIIFADLDSTLLTTDKKISKTSFEAINAAQKNGILFVPATGRHLGGIPKELFVNADIFYALTANGSALWQMQPQKCLLDKPIPETEVEYILQLCKRLEVCGDIFAFDKCYTDDRNLEILKKADLKEPIRNYILSSRTHVNSVEEFFMENKPKIHKITMNFKKVDEYDTAHNRQKMIDILSNNKNLAVVTGGANNIEVTRADATKGSAIEFLLKYLKISKDEAAAFGDSQNDFSMLDACKYFYAPQNAYDLLKEKATEICDSNDNDGVAKKIFEIIKENK